MSKYAKLLLTVFGAFIAAWAGAAQVPGIADSDPLMSVYIGAAAAAAALIGGIQESPVGRKKWSPAKKREEGIKPTKEDA